MYIFINYICPNLTANCNKYIFYKCLIVNEEKKNFQFTKNNIPTNLLSQGGKDHRTTSERTDDISLNTCNLRDGNINDNWIQINNGSIIRRNFDKKFESNERQKINKIIDQKEVYKVV